MPFNPGKDRNRFAALNRVMDSAWFGSDVSSRAQPPDVLNGEFLTAVNAAGTGTVNMIGVDSSDRIVFPSGGPVGLQVVSLAAAQLFAMNGAPVALLPAPGAGKALFVRGLVFEMLAGSVAFTGGGAVSFVYHGGAVSVVTGTILAAVVTAVPGTTFTQLGDVSAANGITIPANTGVDITNATAAFAAGNGTAKVHLAYSIISA